MAITIPYKPHEKQKLIHESDARFRVVICGRRFGKTLAAVNEMIKEALIKKSHIWYVAPTYRQAKLIIWRELFEFLPKQVIKNKNQVELSVELTNGSFIEVKGAENPDSLRGTEVDFVVLDECAFMRETVWSEIIYPMLFTTKGRALFTTTPKGLNWVYDLFQTSDPDYQSFKFSSWDNPYIPREELEKAKERQPEEVYRQEIMADFVAFKGQVYKQWDETVHLIKDYKHKPEWPTYRCFDFGYTNPFVRLKLQVDPSDNVYVYDEYYRTQESTSTHADVLKELDTEDFEYSVCDPSGADQRRTLNERGIPVISKRVELNKGQTSIGTGINIIRRFLDPKSDPKIFVDESCVNLRREFNLYHYPDGADGKNQSEVPIKDNDHALDALRYFFLYKFRSYADAIDPKRPFPEHSYGWWQEQNKKKRRQQASMDYYSY